MNHTLQALALYYVQQAKQSVVEGTSSVLVLEAYYQKALHLLSEVLFCPETSRVYYQPVNACLPVCDAESYVAIKHTAKAYFPQQTIQIKAQVPAWKSLDKISSLPQSSLGDSLLGTRVWDPLSMVLLNMGSKVITTAVEVSDYCNKLNALKAQWPGTRRYQLELRLFYKTSTKHSAMRAALVSVRSGSAARLGHSSGILKGATSIKSAPLILKL